MKRFLCIALLAALAACTTVNGVKQTPAQALATAQTYVVKACKIVPALVTSLQTTTGAQPASAAQAQTLLTLASLQVDVTKVCAIANTAPVSLSLATISGFVNTNIPEVQKVIAASSLSDQAKLDANLAVGALQAALLIAVANAS